MATHFRILEPGRQFFDANGAVLAGGKINTYVAGSTTNTPTYQDNAGVTAHANPIILDSAGRIPAAVFGASGIDYKITVTDSDDATIFTEDNIEPVNDVSVSAASQWVAGPTPTFASTTTFTLTGDQTSTFHTGRRLRLTDSSTLYGTIVKSAYSSSTTVTVNVDGGTSLSASLSAVDYGLVSADNAAISPGFEHIVSGSVSSVSELDFTDLSTDFVLYKVMLTDLAPATDGTNFWFRVSTDNGSTFITSGYHHSRITGISATVSGAGSNSDSAVVFPAFGDQAGEQGAMEVTVYDPANSAVRTWMTALASQLNQTPASMLSIVHGVYGAEAAVDAIRFMFSSGNIATCSYSVFGVRKRA